MADSSNLQDWVRYAEDNYRAALSILEEHPSSASYLLCQAVEKYIQGRVVVSQRG